jgi:hypothetical protein
MPFEGHLPCAYIREVLSSYLDQDAAYPDKFFMAFVGLSDNSK